MAGAEIYTPAQLAELLQVSERQLHDWRRQYGWPMVAIGRTIRFTKDQVDEILHMHTQRSATPATPRGLPGQTRLSVARHQGD